MTMAEEERVEAAHSDQGRALGIERWVQFGFIASAVIAFWLFDKIVMAGWDFLALKVNSVPEPEPTIVSAIAAVLGVVTGVGLYKHARAKAFANEAAGELSRVTWPTRKETWSNTVVTIVTSIIAAVILFVFDAAWSAITDLIYKV
jgi:preprotein translocase subunit SecE